MADLDLDFGGEHLLYLIHVGSLLTLLFAIGNITVLEGPVAPLGSIPDRGHGRVVLT